VNIDVVVVEITLGWHRIDDIDGIGPTTMSQMSQMV